MENLRKIIHVDMDAFYASVEQRDFPEYRNKPVVVGGSPQSRGVVATASYEGRSYGIRSAMATAHAYRLCPHAIFVPPRFDVYKKVSDQIREIFFSFTDLVEPLSLDEAYLDVTNNKAQISSALRIAREIRHQIERVTGLTASAGVSHNKFLAKLASDLHKPNGLTHIPIEKAADFIAQLPVGKIHGIGKATEQKMNRLGIYTGADLRAWNEADLHAQFGKVATYYYSISRGIDDRKVSPSRVRKSVGAERTFSEDLDQEADIHFQLARVARILAERLQRIPTRGKTITLKLRYSNFESISRSVTLPDYIDNESELVELGKKLMHETEVNERQIRLLGLSVSNLDLHENNTQPGFQLDLFH